MSSQVCTRRQFLVAAAALDSIGILGATDRRDFVRNPPARREPLRGRLLHAI
jgi:hypothetical protein